MSALKITIALLAVIGIVGTAAARDNKAMYPIADALNAPAAQEKLDKGIALYFGNQKHPAAGKTLGEWSTNKKTNGFNKSDAEACDWAFLSAVLALQNRAREEGGNAVIDIKSNYKNQETVSDTEFMCGSGALMSGVALKGTVVRIGK